MATDATRHRLMRYRAHRQARLRALPQPTAFTRLDLTTTMQIITTTTTRTIAKTADFRQQVIYYL